MKNSLKIMKIVSVLSIILPALLITTCGGGDGDVSPPGPDVNQWTSFGPDMGNVFDIAIDPVNTDTLYMCTGDQRS